MTPSHPGLQPRGTLAPAWATREWFNASGPMQLADLRGRVVVLHLAIIFGGWIAMALGSSLGVLFLLIVGKTLMDLKLHVKLHEQATHPLVTPTKM